MEGPNMTISPSLASDVSVKSRLVVPEELCPLCEQPIPHDRFDEVKKRIESRHQENLAEITADLQTKFLHEKAEILLQAQQEATAALEQERIKASEREAVARAEGLQTGEAAAQKLLAAAEKTNQQTQ